jgi:hypothetical protein
VNIRLIRNTIVAVSMGISALNFSCQLQADAADFCSKEVLLAYFPENFVRETLKTFKVPHDQWNAIIKELNANEKDVVKLVDEKATQLNPNPLKDRSPESRQETVKIFRETILEIFGNVLKAHGITDDKQIQAMLADVQQQKAKNFAKCMEKQRALFNKERSSSSNPSSTEPDSETSPEPSTSMQNKPYFLANTDEDEDKSSEKQDEDSETNQENNKDLSENDTLDEDNKNPTDDSNHDEDNKSRTDDSNSDDDNKSQTDDNNHDEDQKKINKQGKKESSDQEYL